MRKSVLTSKKKAYISVLCDNYMKLDEEYGEDIYIDILL